MKQIYCLFIIVCFSNLVCKAQNDSIAYSSNFKFKEGLYTSYEEFKNNRPKITRAIIDSLNPDFTIIDGELVRKELSLKNTLNYIDSNTIKEIRIRDLTGQAFQDNVCFFYKGTKYKAAKKGRLCFLYFVSETYIQYLKATNEVLTTETFVSKQLMLDFETGEIMKFDLKHFSNALNNIDPDLYNEFNKLSSRKQNDMKFIYLNKVNEKHPVYFKL